jgi:hypothetical protein
MKKRLISELEVALSGLKLGMVSTQDAIDSIEDAIAEYRQALNDLENNDND